MKYTIIELLSFAESLEKNEFSDVDTSLTHYNKNVLYPSSWYKKYGGEKPTVTSFENAMSFNEIDWYDGSLEVESSVNKTCEVDGYNFKNFIKFNCFF